MTRLGITVCLLVVTASFTASPLPAAAPAPSSTKPATGVRRAEASSRGIATKVAGQRRLLEEIHIEGEMPAPQVLFVTARAQRRLLEPHHARYLPTSLELAERTTLPARFALTRRPAERP